MEIGEAFGAVAALQQEGATGGDLGQLLAEGADFAGEHQRQRTGQPFFDLSQCCGVVIVGHLRRWAIPPAVRSPRNLRVLRRLGHRYS